jgi:hypothetical protein
VIWSSPVPRSYRLELCGASLLDGMESNATQQRGLELRVVVSPAAAAAVAAAHKYPYFLPSNTVRRACDNPCSPAAITWWG